MIRITMFAVFCFLSALLFTSEKSKAGKYYLNNEDTTYHIFSIEHKGFGFDILIGKRIFIHQPFVPAANGNKSFETKIEAEKTARLMLFKLKNHEMPPTISTAELDSLHIHH